MQQGPYPTPGTAGNALLNVTIDSSAPPGSTYWVQPAACTSAANCSSSTGTMYTSIGSAASYSKVPYVNNVPGTALATGVAIPTFSVTCGGVLTSEGTAGAPLAVSVPWCGEVDSVFGSYYVVTAAGGETLITLNNLTDDVDLAVYTNATFGTLDANWWCPIHYGIDPETCVATAAVGPGPVYIQVLNYTTAGATYTLNLTGPPPLPGNSVIAVSGLPLAIPDNDPGGATSTLTVSSGPTSLTRVAVEVNITHTFDGDLTLTLISPLGTPIVLSAINGGGGVNYTNTVFMDGTGNPIFLGAAPFTGNFDPEQPLAYLAGENANGIWSLKVVDSDIADIGTIDGWTLYFE